MQEIILCRLGNSHAPHWIQMKYFEHVGKKDIITLNKEIAYLKKEEMEHYKCSKNDGYIHYEKVRNPDGRYDQYEYTTKQGYDFISRNEKDMYYFRERKLREKFDNCFECTLDVEYDNKRTDGFVIQLVRDYQKAFPDGDKKTPYGKWCWNVVSIPDGVEYEIDEPEGCNECIREVHRVWTFDGELIGNKKEK